MTVTATTSASMAASRSPTGKPWDAAYAASKQSRFSSLNSSTATTTSTMEVIPINMASATSIDAVLP